MKIRMTLSEQDIRQRIAESINDDGNLTVPEVRPEEVSINVRNDGSIEAVIETSLE